MLFHHKIIHHVRKHKQRVVAHVQRHHKKYILGAGLLSWMAVYKIIWLLIIFFGASQINAPLGADYYDAEYYTTQRSGVINISNIIDMKNTDTTEDILAITWCILTGENGTWCIITGQKEDILSPNK
jgi:hypothetical protein